MTHEQVKQVVEWLAQTGYIQISINPKQVEIIANDFIEAHPEATAPPISDTAPVHTVTAPPTLQESINKHLEFHGGTDDKWYLQVSVKYYLKSGKVYGFFNKALKGFASEVAGEKDKRIAELEAEVKRLTHTPVVVWGEPMKCESCGRSATIIHRTDEGVLCNKCFQNNRR